MSQPSFIRAYGLHWDRQQVEWTDNGSLLGHQGERVDSLRLVDFWNQTGIYILHDEFGAYYVGQVDRQPLGRRLLQHTKDDHADRWERFFWFGFNAILTGQTRDGLRRVKATWPERLLSSVADTISNVEALLIMSLGTHRTGNMQREVPQRRSLASGLARRAGQVPQDRPASGRRGQGPLVTSLALSVWAARVAA